MPGKRRRGRPKRSWLDSIRNDLSERELHVRGGRARPGEMEASHKTHRPHIIVGKDEDEEEEEEGGGGGRKEHTYYVCECLT